MSIIHLLFSPIELKFLFMDWQAKCVPCFFNQVISLGENLKLDPDEIRNLLKEIAKRFSTLNLKTTPPEFAIAVYSVIKEKTGIYDPYKQVKDESNKIVLQVYKRIKQKIKTSPSPLLTALFVAIAGNIIDYGVRQDIDILSEINRIVESEIQIKQNSFLHISEFLKTLEKAKTILYLGDNCGEVVLDKLFIEEILCNWPKKNITFVVRGGPIINDVTIKEAKQVGLDKVCNVISSGVQAPGTILKLANPKLIKLFQTSDMVISKGQGNFESLSEINRKVFFLFMAKCDVVSQLLKCPKGQILLI